MPEIPHIRMKKKHQKPSALCVSQVNRARRDPQLTLRLRRQFFSPGHHIIAPVTQTVVTQLAPIPFRRRDLFLQAASSHEGSRATQRRTTSTDRRGRLLCCRLRSSTQHTDRLLPPPTGESETKLCVPKTARGVAAIVARRSAYPGVVAPATPRPIALLDVRFPGMKVNAESVPLTNRVDGCLGSVRSAAAYRGVPQVPRHAGVTSASGSRHRPKQYSR